MVDMSQIADSETSESESESDSEDEDDKPVDNMKENVTTEEPKNVTQEDQDEVEKKEEIMDQENTSAKDQDTENTSNKNQKHPATGSDLLAYINNTAKAHTVNQSSNQDDENSQGTAAAGNHTNRNINDVLNGYTVPPPTTNVIYYKAKIQIPSSEKPTEQLRNTLGMFLTTLLKVDKDFVLYNYKITRQ